MIQSITPERIRSAAGKYLSADDLVIAVVGRWGALMLAVGVDILEVERMTRGVAFRRPILRPFFTARSRNNAMVAPPAWLVDSP